MKVSWGEFALDVVEKSVRVPFKPDRRDVIALWFVLHLPDYLERQNEPHVSAKSRQFTYLAFLLAEAIENVANTLSPAGEEPTKAVSTVLRVHGQLAGTTLEMVRLAYDTEIDAAKAWLLQNRPFDEQAVIIEMPTQSRNSSTESREETTQL
eukprot:Protomagalhaensia_wolfi_Nauph_80__4388@NODE_4491_length_559_cov_41_559615_g3593_i0_p1_GENE_NODE_4491_length_559_cov_41_559615_g3593_i0NODE_4491_length_559_cov_41_559615_g3593_i0_p1_ORF_typecomplete_len152_score21_17_NODE_4491_length_559_cov_41_559615_g3593_i036491